MEFFASLGRNGAEQPIHAQNQQRTVESLQAVLGSVGSRRPLMGKRVLLIFGEEDDYYSYISYYYSEGRHSQSAGLFIHGDYAHVAIPFLDLARADHVITHEVTHNYLWALRLPTWLNEALSQRMETEIRPGGRSQHLVLTGELAEEHRGYWNEQNIQKFWAGLSFHEPGEVNKLSYSLSLILLEVPVESVGRFPGFRSKRRFSRCRPGCVVKIPGPMPRRSCQRPSRPRQLAAQPQGDRGYLGGRQRQRKSKQ